MARTPTQEPLPVKNPQNVAVACLVILTILAVVVALDFAETMLAPVVLGIVVAIVLSPVARRLDKLGVHRAASAGAALLLAVLMTTLVLTLLGPVLAELIDRLPLIQYELSRLLEDLSRSFRGLDRISEEINKSLSGENGDAMEAAMPTLTAALWGAPNFAAQLMIFGGTLFFFILVRDDLYETLPVDTRALCAADEAVSYYFVTVTLINAGLGTAVFAVMTLIGLPNPILWGAAAFLLNYVLYLGPIMMMTGLFVAGVTEFSGGMSFVPVVAFFLLNLSEAQFVTPAFVGQQMRINPLGVFLAILFGLWLWGPVGGIVSLPVLVWIRMFVKRRKRLVQERAAA